MHQFVERLQQTGLAVDQQLVAAGWRSSFCSSGRQQVSAFGLATSSCRRWPGSSLLASSCSSTSEHTWKTPRFLRSTASNVLGIGVFLGFFTNLFLLNLLGELILQPTVVFLTLLALVARRDPAHRPAERLAEAVLVAIGLALLSFSAVQLIGQWDTLDLRLLALEFLLPVWLTAGVLPFIYAMAVYGAYERAFLRINHAVEDRRSRVRAKLAALLTCLLHLSDADALTFYWARRAGEATSLSGARQVLREFRLSLREAEQQQEEARLRLVRNAGLQGTDDDGRQLDQREFEETKRALRWLATCQMGWYRNRGGRYRAELLDILGGFTNYGLPGEHGMGGTWRPTVNAGGPAGEPSPAGT